MKAWVALLRSVNVGGTGRLLMSDLERACRDVGLTRVRTYIQSGNVVFAAKGEEPAIRARIEAALLDLTGRRIDVFARRAGDLNALLAANPFPEADPRQVGVTFLAAPPPEDWAARVSGLDDERMVAIGREIIVHYPAGMGQSRLRWPRELVGTTRNLNTIARLAALAAQAEEP